MAKVSRQKDVAKSAKGSPPAQKYEQTFEKIYRLVLRIPRGRVMTYGQIARLLEDRYSPRLVGWAMHATPQDDRNIPWHRVINSRGGISTGRVIIQEPQLQRWMLEEEGVVFDDRGYCNLSVYQWSPVTRRPRAKNDSVADLKSTASIATPKSGKSPKSGKTAKKTDSVKGATKESKKTKTTKGRKQLKKDSEWK
jgi:methylated-DNA-protein-cysteine methyltransferase-like protein